MIIILMMILARMCGGGFGSPYLDAKKDGGKMPINLSFLPEVFFGMGFGIYNYAEFHSLIAALLVTIWSFLWMETGHGTVLQWGRDPSIATSGRTQFLTPVVNIISKVLGYDIGSIQYCRIFMAVKGFLIGLPTGGILLSILWPLSYEIGFRFKKNELSEILTGISAGISIVLFNLLLKGI